MQTHALTTVASDDEDFVRELRRLLVHRNLHDAAALLSLVNALMADPSEPTPEPRHVH